MTRCAARRITAEALDSVYCTLHRLQHAIEAEPAEAVSLSAEFHLGIYEASASELLTVLRGYWTRIQLELSERVYSAEMPREFVSEHIAIVDALERREAELAADRMSRQSADHARSSCARARPRLYGALSRTCERPDRAACV